MTAPAGSVTAPDTLPGLYLRRRLVAVHALEVERSTPNSPQDEPTPVGCARVQRGHETITFLLVGAVANLEAWRLVLRPILQSQHPGDCDPLRRGVWTRQGPKGSDCGPSGAGVRQRVERRSPFVAR